MTQYDVQGVPKKLLTEFWEPCWETRILGHSSPKVPKLIQTVQYNLDGPDWFKNLVSQSSHQNSVANFFWGRPVWKTSNRWWWRRKWWKMNLRETSGQRSKFLIRMVTGKLILFTFLLLKRKPSSIKNVSEKKQLLCCSTSLVSIKSKWFQVYIRGGAEGCDAHSWRGAKNPKSLY